ncbi:MAG: hypothetical protein JAY63_00030 [Candidatus Thiodiazotropha taylori]|nr:hypothetical protein [Candidatus Thiodiazotropha taylori]
MWKNQELKDFLKDKGVLVTLAVVLGTAILAFARLEYEIRDIKRVLPKDDLSEPIKIPEILVDYHDVNGDVKSLRSEIKQAREKAIEMEAVAKAAAKDAEDDAEKIESILDRLTKAAENPASIDVGKLRKEIISNLQTDAKFINSVGNFKLVIGKTRAPDWKYVDSDGACVATCPPGQVLISTVYESPSKSTDCGGGMCATIKLVR